MKGSLSNCPAKRNSGAVPLAAIVVAVCPKAFLLLPLLNQSPATSRYISSPAASSAAARSTAVSPAPPANEVVARLVPSPCLYT